MQNWIAQRRKLIEGEVLTISERRDLSPVFYAQYASVLPALRTYARGRLIDLGCGTAPFADLIADQVSVYHGMDLWPRSPRTVLAADIQQLAMIRDETYDTAISLEVLEHVPAPWLAVDEIYRILKPGAHFILTVPHLSRLHDVPHDYYRYTRYGIAFLLQRSGFEIVTIEEKAGLATFLGHQLSTVLISAGRASGILRGAVESANKWLVTRPAYALDRRILPTSLFPVGYLAVARRPVRADHASELRGKETHV